MTLLDDMSLGLTLPKLTIHGIAKRANVAYKTYQIPKRNGGNRTIHHPSKELKSLQRWLLQNTISDWVVHPSAGAYRPGLNIRKTAEVHSASQFLLRMDFKSFFPSILDSDIVAYLSQSSSGWAEEDIALFVSLVCRRGKLTIGAPTSPSISNALCFGLDVKLHAAVQNEELLYSRYADDLIFSAMAKDTLGKFPDRVKSIVKELDIPSNLSINEAKTRHASKKGRRKVLGLILGSDGQISIGRTRKRFIRRQIFRYDDLTPAESKQLAGLLAFAKDIEPDLVNRLILKYGHKLVSKAQTQ